MNPEKFSAIPKKTTQEPEKASEAEDTKLKKARERAGDIFDSCASSERIPLIMKELDVFFGKGYFDRDVFEEQISKIDQTDRDIFVEGVTKAILPLLEFISENPEEYEKLRRKKILNEGNYVPVNDLIYYGKTGEGNIHIHIAPHEQTSIGEKIRLLREGLKKLAEEVKNDPDVDEITATSWIVAEAPNLLKRLGFTLQGEISNEFRQEHFADETRPVHHASISREILLEKYLSKNYQTEKIN